MNDLRTALDQLLLDEPPLPETTEQVLTAGRRARRRRTTLVAGGLVGGLAVVTLALPHDSGPPARQVVTAPTPAPTPSATVARGPGEVDCPDGQGPSITADLGTVLAEGDVTQRGWLDDYVAQRLRATVVWAAPRQPALVNGERVVDPRSSAWVPQESMTHVLSEEYVVRTGDVWRAHPSAFVGCAPRADPAP